MSLFLHHRARRWLQLDRCAREATPGEMPRVWRLRGRHFARSAFYHACRAACTRAQYVRLSAKGKNDALLNPSCSEVDTGN